MMFGIVNQLFALFCAKKAFLPQLAENRKPENPLNSIKKAENLELNRKPESCKVLEQNGEVVTSELKARKLEQTPIQVSLIHVGDNHVKHPTAQEAISCIAAPHMYSVENVRHALCCRLWTDVVSGFAGGLLN